MSKLIGEYWEWEVFPVDGNEKNGEYCVWRGEFELPCVTRDVWCLEDAKVIANAPKLFNACKEALEILENKLFFTGYENSERLEVCRILRDVLEKVEK